MAYVLGMTPGDLKGRMDQYDYDMPDSEVLIEVDGRLRSIREITTDGNEKIVIKLY